METTEQARRRRTGRLSRRWLLGAGASLAGLAGSLALAACGPEGLVGAPRAGTTGGAATGPAAPSEEQVLRLNLGSEPDTIDPQKASFVQEITVIMRVFSNLLRFDEKGELQPEIAEKMPVVSQDGKTLTFTLRPGLKYSDGRPLTAKDFEYGWKRHLDPRTKGEYAFTGFIIEGAQELNGAIDASDETLNQFRDAVGVRAKDERTIEFRLKAPAPWFMSVLATWCGVPTRQDMVQKGDDAWTEPATYIGNGPYVLKEWEHQNRMVFEANNNYYRGAPPLRTVDYSMINEGAVAFAAYLNDELDVTGVSREDLPAVNGNPELKQQYRRYAGNATFYIGFNTLRAPFDKVGVRKAFSAAFDRESYVTNVLGGLGEPASQFVPPRLPGHFEDLKGQKFDAALAKRLLAEAGFADGKALPELKFTFSASARTKTRVEALIDQTKRTLGAEMLADPVESRAHTALIKSQDTTPPIFLLGWQQDYPDPQDWYTTVFHSKATVSHTGWSNAEFDRLTEQADVLPDRAKRNELYKRAAQILLDESPVAFLYHSVASYLVKPYVFGYPDNPLDYFEGQSNLMNMKILKR
ncbi:MAG: peptide ABC transporter substrate-binding protein [Chloroflexi bacterium]|nr:peptide ABC transporter substrate-binding protein [Chloroflexota bacterium]